MFNFLECQTWFINCRGPNSKWLKRKRALAYVFLLVPPKPVHIYDLSVTFPCACESGYVQEYARHDSDEKWYTQMCYTQVIAKMEEILFFSVKTNLQVLPLDPVLCSSSAFCCARICSCLTSKTVLDGTFILGSRRLGCLFLSKWVFSVIRKNWEHMGLFVAGKPK